MKNSWKETVSVKTDGPIGISVLWNDWTFAGSETLFYRGLILAFWHSHSSPHSVSELTSHANK